MLEKDHGGLRDQRSSSSHSTLQHGRLCPTESSEQGQDVTGPYWVLQGRDGLSHLLFEAIGFATTAQNLCSSSGELKNSCIHKCCLLVALHVPQWDCEAMPFATKLQLGDKKATKELFRVKTDCPYCLITVWWESLSQRTHQMFSPFLGIKL